MPQFIRPRIPKLVVFLGAILIVIIAVLVWLWSVYGYRVNQYSCTNYAMGAYVQQTVYGTNAEDAAADAAKAIGQLENLISWRIEGSDIQKLNAEAGTNWEEMDEQTLSILAKCLEVAERSNGAFDPTILPVSALWDFGGDNQQVPEESMLEEFMGYVNYQDLRIDEEEGSASLKYHYMGVDLGAVGKGAACQEAVEAYAEAGASGIVSVGGSVGICGEKPDGSLWNIAVRDPNSGEEKTAALGTLSLESGYISTSGSYEKYFTEDGVTYHHLLDPKTGYPAESGLVSVTVICDDGTLSDALSTACFVLGLEQGVELLESYGAGGVFIDQENHIFLSGIAQDAFELMSEEYTIEELP